MTAASEITGAVDQATLEALRDGVAGVLAEQCDSTAIHAFIDGKRPLDRELWSQAASLGWLGFGVPEAYGGVGLGASGLAILHTELGRAAAPGPFIPTLVAAQALVEAGAETARQAWLPRFAAGEVKAAVPAALNGVPLSWSGGGVSGALRCLGGHEAGLALVPAGDAWLLLDLAGAAIDALPVWDLTRDLVELRFDGVQPAAILENGAAVTAAVTRAMALAVAADSAGAARSITERTIAYMKQREQFGQPIAGFQALKHRAANLHTSLAVLDEMMAHAVDHAGADDGELWTLLAKAEVTETAVAITTDCVQLHGGVGFTWDFDPHVYLKRARLNEVLVMPNLALRDKAAAVLAALTRAGQSALELVL